MKQIFSTLFFILLVIAPLAQSQERCDIDGDSVSELVTFSGSTWTAEGSAKSTNVLNETFGVSTDILVPGYWESAGTFNVGIIRSDSKSGALVWKILKSDGTIFQSNFGSLGNIIISGGDFDGNGVTDAAILGVSSSGDLQWTVIENFARGSAKTIKFTKGKNSLGGRVFFLTLSGKHDVLAIFYLNSSGKSCSLFTIDPKTKKTTTYGSFPARLGGGDMPRPLPVRGENGKSRLAFITTDETDTTIETFNLKGHRISHVTIPGKGGVAVGNYLSDETGEEVALQNSSNVTFYNPFTKALVKDTVSGGTIVDDITIEATSAPTPVPTVAPTATAEPTATATSK